MHKILVIAAACGLALPAVSIRAEETTVKVQYSDLNLTSPHGQKRLDRRIESAARKVCGYHSSANPSTIESGVARACYKQAKAGALTQLATAVEQSVKGG